MTSNKHRNGEVSLNLSKEEAERLFRLVREGRKAIYNNDKNYDSGFALDVMTILDGGRIAQ